MRRIIRQLLNYCRKKSVQINPSFLEFVGLGLSRFRPNSIWLNRLNSLSLKSDANKPDVSATAEILIVVTKKDFPLLKCSLEFAINSVKSFNLIGIHLIVPNNHYDEAKEITNQMQPEVTVHAESEYLSNRNVELLSKRFENRIGWVLQQLLKILFSNLSKANFVLVVDADTILLEPRPWLQINSRQILSLSEERHDPYYMVLDFLGIKNRRDYSFITHHMVYQPWAWQEIFRSINVTNQDDLIRKVLSLPLDSESPFSLDYEMYGQYLLGNYPHLVDLRKWSNLECASSNLNPIGLREGLAKYYYSVSVHSWKNT